MANRLYDKGRNGFLIADINWLADTIKCTLVDTALYTVDLANHDFINDVPVGARVGTAVTLASKAAVDGIADAGDLNFLSVTGATTEALVIWKDTGVEATSRLIAYIDTATGLPVTPNGGSIAVNWDNGADKIFKL